MDTRIIELNNILIILSFFSILGKCYLLDSFLCKQWLLIKIQSGFIKIQFFVFQQIQHIFYWR